MDLNKLIKFLKEESSLYVDTMGDCDDYGIGYINGRSELAEEILELLEEYNKGNNN